MKEISDLIIDLKEWYMILGEDQPPRVKYIGTDYYSKSTKTVNPEDYYCCGFMIKFFKYEKGYEIKNPIYRLKK